MTKCANGHNWSDNWGWTRSPVFNIFVSWCCIVQSHISSVRSTEMSGRKSIFSNIEISNKGYWILTKIYKDVTLSPIIMVQWKMTLNEMKRSYWRYTHFPLNHDYGRKSIYLCNIFAFWLWKASIPPLQPHEIHHDRGPLTPPKIWHR